MSISRKIILAALFTALQIMIGACSESGPEVSETPVPSPEVLETRVLTQEEFTGTEKAEERPGLRQDTIAAGKAGLEMKNPFRKIIWFEIDCGDGKAHIFYSTAQMDLRSWLKSDYNTERWRAEGEHIVSGDGTLTVTDLPYGLDTVLREGTVFRTGPRYVRTVPESGAAGGNSGELPDDFEEGVFFRGGDLVIREYGEEGRPDRETIYVYDRGQLRDVVANYYCSGPGIGTCREFAESSGLFRSVTSQGNMLTCVYNDEEAGACRSMSRGELYRALLERSGGKDPMEVVYGRKS